MPETQSKTETVEMYEFQCPTIPDHHWLVTAPLKKCPRCKTITPTQALYDAARYSLRVGYGADDCGDHCHGDCHWCQLRAAVAKAEGR
jgi:hypothetical protein